MQVGRRAQIFVRPGTIVYSSDIRAIIRRDKLLLFEAKEKEQPHSASESKSYSAPEASKDEKKQENVSEPPLAERVQKEMRRISLQGRQTFGDGVAEGNPFEFV